MSAATINSAGLGAHQRIAPGVQRPLKTSPVATSGSGPLGSDAGGGLFADLVAALTGGAVTFNGFAGGTAAGSSGSSSNGISAASSTSAPSTSAASRGQIAQDVQEFTQSLRQALAPIQSNSSTGAAAGTASACAGVDLANLDAAYSKLAADLGIHGATAASRALNVASSPNTSTRPRGVLQSVLQHVQRQGSWAASAGHVVHVVA